MTHASCPVGTTPLPLYGRVRTRNQLVQGYLGTAFIDYLRYAGPGQRRGRHEVYRRILAGSKRRDGKLCA